MAFDAGALIFKIQTAGAQTAQQQLKALDQTVQGVGKTAAGAKPKVDGLGTASDAAGKKASAAKRPLDDQAKATQQVGDQSQAAAVEQMKQQVATQQQAEQFKKLSVVLLAAGVAVGAMVGLAVAKYAEFDEAMSNVAAATMATSAEQKVLGEAALKAGADTAFSATEAAQAEEELAKAGLSVSDIVGGSLNGALALAAAGQLGVARSAEIMATTLKQFKLPAEDAAHVADLLAAGAGKAQGSVEDLSLALGYVGPVAAGLGISVEETAGALAYFASQGQIGERAGTSLRGVLMSLTSPSSQAAATMKQYGIEIFDSAGNMKSMAEVSQILQDAFAGLTEAERSEALGRIFGNQQITAARILYSGGADSINEWTDAVNDSGYAADQAAMRQDNLAGDIEKLGGAMDTALIKTGSAANDVLREMVQSVTALVDWYGELPQPVQSTALVLGVATAAVLLFQGATLGLTAKFVELKKTLDLANISLGRTALVGAGVGVALAGVMVVVAHLAQVHAEARERAQSYADALQQSGESGEKALRDLAVAGLQAEQGIDLLFFKISQGSALDAAKQLGISLDTVTDAALGNADAMAELSVYMQAADGDEQALKKVMDETGLSRLAAIGLINSLVKGVREQSDALEEGRELTDQSKEATDSNTDSTKSAAEAYVDAAKDVDGLNSSLSDLIDQINKANGVGQDAISANIDYQDSLRKVDEQIDKVNKGTKGYSKTLDITTEAGSENMSMLVDLAKNAEDAARKQYDLDGDTEHYRKTLQNSRKQLLDRIHDLGLSGQKAEDLADQILKIPSSSEWKLIADTKQASWTIEDFQRKYGTLSGSIIYRATLPDLNGPASGSGRPGIAKGAVLDFYAGGGVVVREDHVAQIARAGEWRVWAEPETGGEAYIPLSPAKRPRSVAVLRETATRMGFDIVPAGARSHADGGVDPAPVVYGGIRPGDRVVFEVEGMPLTAVAKRVVSSYDAAESRRAGAGVRGLG